MSGAPETLGPYVIEELLGRGGMGAVYRGRHQRLGVLRAVKLLTGRITPDRVERFAREAQALARLNHPSVVAIHDVGQTPTGELFYAMDLIEGRPLNQVYERLPLAEAVALAVAIARAVEVLHEAGLVHRDIKPGNVMLRPDGSPVVLDLGLAFALDSDSRLTKTGAIVGTPLYMAPEQGSSARPTPAADVFSLGLLALELVTGVEISELDTLPAFASPPRVSELDPSLPLAFDKVIRRATQRRSELRYARAGEFACALEAAGRQGGFTRRARRAVVGVLAALALVGGAALAAHGLTREQVVSPSQSQASASSTPAPVALPDLSSEAERLLRELQRLPSSRQRHARALAWLERHPRGLGREGVIAAAQRASLEFELLWLPGTAKSMRLLTAAFASDDYVIGSWNYKVIAHWRLDTRDPQRPTATQVSLEPIEGPEVQGRFVSDSTRGAVIRHSFSGVEWIGPHGVSSGLPSFKLPPGKPAALALHPSGSLVALARGQGVYLVSVPSGKPSELRPPGKGRPRRLAFSLDGRQLAIAWEGRARGATVVAQDYWVEVCDLETRVFTDRWTLVSQPNSVLSVGPGVFLSGNSDGQFGLLRVGSPAIETPYSRAKMNDHRSLAHRQRVVDLARDAGATWVLSVAQARDSRPISEFGLWDREGEFVRGGELQGVVTGISVAPGAGWALTSGSRGFGLLSLGSED